MYRNATFKEKFADLQEWVPYLVGSVKKDLKNDHLKKDLFFVKKYLPSNNLNKISTEELAEAYKKAIQEEEQGEGIAEFIASRWIIKNSDLLHFFEQELSRINPEYSEIETITDAQAEVIIETSIKEYGISETYLFSVLNSVFFSDEHFKSLRLRALNEQERLKEESFQKIEKEASEKSEANFNQEIARLRDKYEKKIAGLQKKYTIDTDALKKQIAQLQRKLQEKA